MQFLITFLEGIISFISPCMLPLLPVYVSYFTGEALLNQSEDVLNRGESPSDSRPVADAASISSETVVSGEASTATTVVDTSAIEDEFSASSGAAPITSETISAQTSKRRLSKSRPLVCSLFFVLGFTIVFCALGLFAGTLGSLLNDNRTVLNIVCGLLVILFGLAYLDVIPLPFLRGMKSGRKVTGWLSALLFGMVYSVSLTPCVGAFLGSAIALASTSGSALLGGALLLTYSLGLGIPFVLSAVLLDQLAGAFAVIKKHYRVINMVCGIFLIVVGVAIACGAFDSLVALLR